MRCRKRRQKCDEQKPSCQRCSVATALCEYQTPLKWGGRSFTGSRFGKVLKQSKSVGVQKVTQGDGSFVYVPPPNPRAQHTAAVSFSSDPRASDEHKWSVGSSSVRESAEEEELEGEHEEIEEIVRIPGQMASFPSTTAFERELLHHYIHTASRATSCHSLVQQDVCRMIVPMAMDNPALLSATLVLSAINQKSLGSPAQAAFADQIIPELKASSLRHLRSILVQPQRQDLNVVMATVRTLCLTEIYDSSHHMNTWRAHFDGARALVNATSRRSNVPVDDDSADLLRRWFSVTEGLVALTPDSIPDTTADDSSAMSNMADDGGGHPQPTIYLDEYTGCSTDLSGLLREIGLAIKLHKSSPEVAQDRLCINERCRERALGLEGRIRDMITRDQVGKAVFHPKTFGQLSRRQAVEFALCNRAYQYSALLHIQRRLFDIPAPHPEVQETVSMIIGCVEGITPAEGLSPLAVLTTPVFVAGCEAFGNDRKRVRRILESMYLFLRIPNIQRTSTLLEEYWDSAQYEPELNWAEFAKLHNHDFLPY